MSCCYPSHGTWAMTTVFFLLAFYGLLGKYSLVCDQILGSLNYAWFTWLCVPNTNQIIFWGAFTPAPVDSFVVISKFVDHSQACRPGKSCPYCDHWHGVGITIDKCYALHDRPPWIDEHLIGCSPLLPLDRYSSI